MKIEVKDIKKRYGSRIVLDGAGFNAEGGECIGILGVNGSGKSTLLSILAGVNSADGGQFLYDGKDLFCYPRQRALLVGYVPQKPPLIKELTAKDNLSLWYSGKEMKAELEGGMLKMLGIDEFLRVPVSKMSGGMKKRLAIGCAVSGHPPVLLLDEPMAALDLPCKLNILEYLKSHKQRGGISIISTHDTLELELCDRCYIVRDGTLVPFEYKGEIESLVKSL